MTASRAVQGLCVALGVLCLAAAATVALVSLPDPAVGGTCGPGATSEAPVVAFFNPVSIGAGPKPSVGSGERPQWQTFVSECQSATDTRMEIAGGILAGALVLIVGIPWAVRRFATEDADAETTPRDTTPETPGWYPDLLDPTMLRWWDGHTWSPPYPRPGAGPAPSGPSWSGTPGDAPVS